MSVRTNILVAAATLIALSAIATTAFGQTVGSSCTAAQCGTMAMVPVGTTSTQFLVCNSNCSASGTWVLSEQMSNNGNIGIGTTSPATLLHVNGVETVGLNGGTGGQITLNGSTSGSAALSVAAVAGTGTVFQLPATNGTNGYVLQTNGSGVTSWVATPAPTFSGLTSGDFCTASSGTAIGCSIGSTGTGNVVLAASPSLTGVITDTDTAIGTTSTDGIVITNTTAATSTVPQYSPRLHFTGQGWKTNSTAASQSVDFVQEVQPTVTGTSAPTGNLVFSGTVNGGTYSALMALTNAGNLGIGTTSPAAPLDVEGSGTGTVLRLGKSGGNYILLGGANSGNEYVSGFEDNFEIYNSYAGGTLQLGAGNNPAVVTLTTSGNVGIGTTTASTTLQVNGMVTASSFSGSGASLTNLAAGSTGQVQYDNGGNLAGAAGLTYSSSSGVTTQAQLASTTPLLVEGCCTPVSVSTSAIVAYWKFDEDTGTSLSDATGNSNNTGTFHGTTGSQWITGKINYGLSFNGSNNYITFPSATSNTFTDVTVSAWFKTSSNGEMLFYAQPGTPWIYISIGPTTQGGSNNKLVALLQTDGGANVTANGATVVNDNNWHLGTVVRSTEAGRIFIYVDGNLDSTTNFANTGTITLPIASIGGMYFNGSLFSGGYLFTGDIDEVGVWSRALSSSEVTALYNSGSGFQYPFTASSTNSQTANLATFQTATGTTVAYVDASGDINSSGTLAATSTVTASALIPSGNTVPANGIYLPSSNTLGFATNSNRVLTINSNGNFGIGTTSPQTVLDVAGGISIHGTKFSTSGCSVSSTTGGATAGTFTLGAHSCTVVITMNGATGQTASNGWTCESHDQTAPTVLIGGESSSTTTTASIAIPSAAGTTDVISFSCMAY
jgi:fibronectin-binding autotransporter adhesin